MPMKATSPNMHWIMCTVVYHKMHRFSGEQHDGVPFPFFQTYLYFRHIRFEQTKCTECSLHRFEKTRKGAVIKMSSLSANSGESKPNSISDIFEKMSYGPAPEADSTVQVCPVLILFLKALFCVNILSSWLP